jgi:2-oxoglutarate ferredoxin oxidoreductase subunit beta
MDMVVMLFDNNVYGLTKNQTSPTSRPGLSTNTHPRGAWLPPLNPSETTLGIANVSFVAQTVDWNPVHVHATLDAAYRHRGLSFVRIFQRCPQYTSAVYAEAQQDPSLVLLLTHENQINADEAGTRIYKNRLEHDPSDLDGARTIASRDDVLPIGLLYCNPDRLVYEDYSTQGMEMTAEEKVHALNKELDRFAI